MKSNKPTRPKRTRVAFDVTIDNSKLILDGGSFYYNIDTVPDTHNLTKFCCELIMEHISDFFNKDLYSFRDIDIRKIRYSNVCCVSADVQHTLDSGETHILIIPKNFRIL